MRNRIGSWLRRNEGQIAPEWIKLVRSRGGDRDRQLTTKELERQFFTDFYDAFVQAIEGDSLARVSDVVDRIAATRVEEEFQLGETLEIFFLLKELIWDLVTQTHTPEVSLSWLHTLEPAFNACLRLLGQAFTRASRDLLSARLVEAEFTTRRLAVATEEADRALSRLRVLYNVSRAMSSTWDQNQILAGVAENLAAVPQIDRCAVWLADAEARELSLAAVHGVDAERLSGACLDVGGGESPIVRAFKTDQIQLVGRLETDEAPTGSLFIRRTLLAVPLSGQDRPLGVVTVDRLALDRPLETAVVEMVQSVVEQAGVALHKTRLYRKLVELNRHLDQRVQERTEELARLNRDLAKLNKKKSDFVAIAAHELKTPLTLIQGYAEMLSEAGTHDIPPAMLDRELDGIVTGVERLRTIIEDIIDVSLIDTEVLALNLEPTSLESVIEMVRRDWKVVAAERRQAISVQPMSDLPYVEADGVRLHQVLDNLVGNAIKYTPDGGYIEIWARGLESQEGEVAFVEVTIADSGVGIDSEEQERIFDKFYRIEGPDLHSSSKTRFMGAGPGLGLTIAKGIVEAHGGRIWVESPGYDPERCPGSQFHVVLPVRSAWGDLKSLGSLAEGLLETSRHKRSIKKHGSI
jgi:signal transduction histidine kinase